jgi:hypothetical protein
MSEQQGRYLVIPPVSNGYACYKVIDRQSEIMPNFALAIISQRMPGARDEAYTVADRLNSWNDSHSSIVLDH